MKHYIEDQNGVAYLHNMLLLVTYPEGDYDTCAPHPTTLEQEDRLVSALYDYHQMEPNLKSGDTIHLPSGEQIARVEGVHVLKEHEGSTLTTYVAGVYLECCRSCGTRVEFLWEIPTDPELVRCPSCGNTYLLAQPEEDEEGYGYAHT